ncbi:hypothetical protein MtrunA17_Chr7g0216511 [Medicago truncatula]|uniref:Uncharacterized protein n=1 Tax=Medicago truncatula TaxID=3880 RepID=A0A396GSS5_MEDTR|nr:hypothetical protein MtrunA17_Chr7g0216511 [Medicago truncatula]
MSFLNHVISIICYRTVFLDGSFFFFRAPLKKNANLPYWKKNTKFFLLVDSPLLHEKIPILGCMVHPETMASIV